MEGIIERKSYPHMWADFLREVAVLVLVFGILDPLIQPSELSAMDLTLGSWSGIVFVLSIVTLLLGMYTEQRRKS
jgi:hypothetical protein